MRSGNRVPVARTVREPSTQKKPEGAGTFLSLRGFRWVNLSGETKMAASEKFLRFAAECEVMAKFTRSPESRATWTRLAERWVRCAELIDRNGSISQGSKLANIVDKPREPARLPKVKHAAAHARA
jgi:hypothetical protein